MTRSIVVVCRICKFNAAGCVYRHLMLVDHIDSFSDLETVTEMNITLPGSTVFEK